MSLYQLRSEVSRLENELRQAERINQELKNELFTVSNGVSQARHTLEDYNQYMRETLQNASERMQHSHRRVIDAVALQGEIEKLYVRFKNIELANKKIRAANNKKYYDFSNYRTVRKIVQGIMDNLDVNMVSDETITKSIALQHLQIPDYWLTCVLISVMAWKNDDRDLADRAMARAVFLDKKHSAIFYMLLNLRLQRDEAALKWFAVYRECEQKGDDRNTFLMLFSLISKTIAETIDETARAQISAYINDFILSCAQAEGYSEADIVERIRYNYARLQPVERLEYATLQKCSGAYDALAANMLRAKNNINILEFILRTVNVPVEQKNAFLKGYIDELIAAPNPAEESVYDEIAYNELVIRLQGDTDAAEAQFETERQRAKNDINLIAEMVGWIYERGNREISGQIRLNLFTLTKGLQEKALEAYTADYRGKRTSIIPIAINDYTSTADLLNESAEISKMESYYTEVKRGALAAVKDLKAYLCFGAAALALAGGFFLAYPLFALTAVGAGFGVFVLYANRSERNRLESVCRDNIRAAADVLRKLFLEFRQYEEQFDAYDAYHDRIVNELNKL
ncbi:MAG: hypothetical protein LBE16_08320 [Clostridiales Family XIII bacterium]|jgi:hypothetical protein|nr:hypothetical protein [Clostridiales Family XIII bacterium]